jgi:RNA polymerase sigma-70 factor (ECF subfamily)
MHPTPDDYTRLYRRHAQPLLLHFQRRVHDPELAAELLADTFESAIGAGRSFRGESERELSGWLWTIARNTLADHFRRQEGESVRRRRMGRVRRALTDREIERVEELAGIAELREAVAQRLEELPVEQREAVRMRVLEDLPYKQIAIAGNTNAETARARVSRGLRALNVALMDEHEAWRRG